MPITVTTKPRQRTRYVVRRGTRPVYRGDNAAEARQVAQHHGEHASTTFQSESALAEYLEPAR